MVVLEDIEKRYPDDTAALTGVSFAVPKGQFCVVLGSSGAGKSTLLRCINGLAMPTSGRTLLGGVPVNATTLPKLRPTIGMIHQSFNLVQRATVATNVIGGALPIVSTLRALVGWFPREYQRRACDLVADVGLDEKHLKRRVSELSGGQQQRVGIARAFMLDPAVVLADEPVASLDPRTSADVLALLARQAKEHGATVLCSLHQVDLATAFAERIVALKAGRVVFDGKPAALNRTVLNRIYDAAAVEVAETESAAPTLRYRAGEA